MAASVRIRHNGTAGDAVALSLLREGAILRDPGPSTRQSSEMIARWSHVHNFIGQPNPRRIPLDRLYAMREDPMIAFGLMFVRVPLIRAKWYIECSDPQVAAFVDYSLRAIWSQLVSAYLANLEFGYSPMVKRFRLDSPKGTYIDPQNQSTSAPIWSEHGIDAKIWKTVIGIPPEQARPRWGKNGDFNGFIWQNSGSYSFGVPVSPFNESNDTSIDVLHALWGTNEREKMFGCSPADEMVLTTSGFKPIGSLDPGTDRLVSYDPRMDEIRRGGQRLDQHPDGYKFEIGSRHFSGSLITIDTDASSTRVTPNHRLTARFTPEAANHFAVYLMRKGDWWRVGTTRLNKPYGMANSGVGNRLTVEKGDEAWILSVHPTKREALYQETLLSNSYHVPDMTFRAANGQLSTEDLEEIWDQIDSQKGAMELLDDFNKDPNLPFYRRNDPDNRRQGGTHKWTVFAGNLIPDLMEIPTDPGAGRKPVWLPVRTSRVPFTGPVYSLEVEPHHHYVSGGAITQNSIYGFPRTAYAHKYWWSYWFRWTLGDRAFERNIDPAVAVWYPDEETIDTVSGETINYKFLAQEAGDNIRSGATVAFPNQRLMSEDGKVGERVWDFKQLESMAKFAELQTSFEYLDVMKLRSIMVPEQSIIAQGGASTRGNISETIGARFWEAMQVLCDEFTLTVNNYMIPQLVAMNFPERKVTAKVCVRSFHQADFQMAQQIITLIGQNDPKTLQVDLLQLLGQFDIPVLSREEVIRKSAEEQAQALQVLKESAQVKAQTDATANADTTLPGQKPPPDGGADTNPARQTPPGGTTPGAAKAKIVKQSALAAAEADVETQPAPIETPSIIVTPEGKYAPVRPIVRLPSGESRSHRRSMEALSEDLSDAYGLVNRAWMVNLSQALEAVEAVPDQRSDIFKLAHERAMRGTIAAITKSATAAARAELVRAGEDPEITMTARFKAKIRDAAIAIARFVIDEECEELTASDGWSAETVSDRIADDMVKSGYRLGVITAAEVAGIDELYRVSEDPIHHGQNVALEDLSGDHLRRVCSQAEEDFFVLSAGEELCGLDEAYDVESIQLAQALAAPPAPPKIEITMPDIHLPSPVAPVVNVEAPKVPDVVVNVASPPPAEVNVNVQPPNITVGSPEVKVTNDVHPTPVNVEIKKRAPGATEIDLLKDKKGDITGAKIKRKGPDGA